MKDKPFQIYKLSILLEVPGSGVSFDRQQEEAWQLISFLTKNNLIANHSLPRSKEEIKYEFKLVSSDVTSEGLDVLREGFHRWLDRNDNINLKEFNMKPLEKALEKVRKENKK